MQTIDNNHYHNNNNRESLIIRTMLSVRITIRITMIIILIIITKAFTKSTIITIGRHTNNHNIINSWDHDFGISSIAYLTSDSLLYVPVRSLIDDSGTPGGIPIELRLGEPPAQTGDRDFQGHGENPRKA